MAKKFTKVMSLLLAMVMVFSMLGVTAMAYENQVGDYLGYDSNGNAGGYVKESAKSIEDGKVTLSKTIAQTGENAFDITLQVTTTEDLEVIKKARDAAIVIVMDVSGSMQFAMDGGGFCSNPGCTTFTNGYYYTDAYKCCHGGWQNAWAVPGYLDQNGVDHGDTRFALMENAVSAFLKDFADETGTAKRMVSMVCYNDKVEKELAWVNVTEDDGMDAAQTVVAPGALAALTGGDTNTSLGLAYANQYLDDAAVADIENTYVLLLTDGAPYTAIQYNADGTYNPRVSGVGYDCDLTVAAADKLKGDHEGTEVYTVCFGMQGKEWTATHSIVNGVLTGNDKSFNIDKLMADLATDADHFFRGENVDEFELSLGSIIEETVSSGAKLWTVIDPMGEYINYEGFEGNYAASFANNTLEWDLLAEEPVSVVDGVYTYEMTYSITLDTAAEGFAFANLYPANEATTLTYAVIENDELKDIKTDYFNVPTVFAPDIPEVPEIPTISFNNGDASNISFMLIDKATGEVEFLNKIDIGSETSFEIPAEDGKISAVFVKQSTSGMFWASEELDEATRNAVIDCLKANNPSYKGHNAFAFGDGQHELEFKKNKFVTYTFTGAGKVVVEDIPETAVPETAAPETTASATEVAAPAETPVATPASEAGFHEESKNHLLIDEAKPISFNIDTDYKSTVSDKYAFVGHGEMSEFWPAILYYSGADESEAPVATVGNTSLYNRGKGADVNGIYLNGEFYPGKVKAFYESVQQPVLMNGDGKAVAVYCADKATGTQTNTLYDVVNIEDAAHFDAATAAKIRAVAVNGYWGGTDSVDPNGSLANVKAMMAASGEFTQEEIDHLTPGVALSATQFAIWELANAGEDSQIVNVQYLEKNRVAGRNGKSWNTLVATPESEKACVDLIFKLSRYMATELPGIPVSQMTTANTVLSYKNILTDVTIEPLQKAADHENNADSNKDNDAYITNVTFNMLPVSEKDQLTVKIVDKAGNVYAESPITALSNNGNGTYTYKGVVLIENNATDYTVVVEGVQYLERNVYLYFAGERGASQTMVGYDEGAFSVDVESTVEKTFNVDEPETPPTVSFNSGDASNISFMLIDKVTGEVEFLKKIDIGSETSFEIPAEDGKISAVFVKQSTSGMFWTSEEVSEDVLNNVIECLKANNPSYKGHNAECFGAGDHDLEFKAGHTVTYTFDGGAECEHECTSLGQFDSEPTEDTTAPETSADPQPDVDTDSEEPVLSEKEQQKAKKQEEKAQKEKEKADKKAEREEKKAEENSEEEIQAVDEQTLMLDEQIEEIAEEIQVIEEAIAAE